MEVKQSLKPSISVCMAVFNGENYILEQIESVLAQLGESDELIICDDQSSDATASLITQKHLDQRVKYYKNPSKLGVIKNFEKALSLSKGNIIFLCDQDDVWLNNKVAISVKNLEKHLLVLSDCILIDENKKVIHQSFFSLNNSRLGIMRNLYKNSYMGCCMAFRRELLDTALPIPGNVPMHDVWLGLLAEFKGSVCFLDKPLILYRRHEKNTALLKSGFSFIKKAKMRIIIFAYIFIRLVKVNLDKFKHAQ